MLPFFKKKPVTLKIVPKSLEQVETHTEVHEGNFLDAVTPYQYALKELGVQEISGPRANPRITEYFSATDLKNTVDGKTDETPWCSAFVNWCCLKANKPRVLSAMARSWLGYGIRVTEPVEGDIVVFSRPPDPNTGHVAFFVRNNGITVTVLGGNQHDKVCYADYPKWRVLGYRRVP